MRAFGKTDTGSVRPTNQDAYILGQLSDTCLFAVVCDGMGGANGGNVASAMAIQVISGRITEGFREDMQGNSIYHMLESAISAANIEIFDRAMAEPELRGMGTTVVAALICGETAYIAHVGDSRAYLITPEQITQITRDHSIVQDMVEKGQLTQSEARNHPRKHFITRALGVEDTVECDYTELTIPKDSTLLICTDGLTNMIESDDIYNTVKSTGAQEAIDCLIASANQAGGSDNITVVTIAQ